MFRVPTELPTKCMYMYVCNKFLILKNHCYCYHSYLGSLAFNRLTGKCNLTAQKSLNRLTVSSKFEMQDNEVSYM